MELIDSEFGPPGFRIITKLLQRIYAKKGYYIEWNEKRRILFASAVKEKASLVDEVVARSVKWGLFNEAVFNKFGILTSADIQINYLDAAKRRDRVDIIREISLSSIAAYENANYVTINSICVNINAQSRVEESKEENSREEERSNGAPLAPSEPKKRNKVERKPFIAPTVAEVRQYFLSTIGQPDHPRHWPEDKCRNEADTFFDHYKTNGWVQGRGKPIKDWQAAVRNWIRNGIKGVFEKAGPAKKDGAPVSHSRPAEAPPALNELQTELNYLFERWTEDPAQVTVISIKADHYNLLKSAHMIAFSEAEVGKIRGLTQSHMLQHGLEGPIAETRLMKAYGVMEFFKQLKGQEKEAVFIP